MYRRRVPDGSDVHLHVQHPHTREAPKCDAKVRHQSASGRKQSDDDAADADDDEGGKLAGVFGYEIKVARLRLRTCVLECQSAYDACECAGISMVIVAQMGLKCVRSVFWNSPAAAAACLCGQ